MSGKGSRRRPEDRKAIEANWPLGEPKRRRKRKPRPDKLTRWLYDDTLPSTGLGKQVGVVHEFTIAKRKRRK